MAKITLTDISSGYLSIATYNANNTLIETAFENTLSRDGTAPNTMGANLDMNSKFINNLADGSNSQDAVTVAQLAAASIVSTSGTAALTTIADAGGNFDATTVEGALTEIVDELAAVTNGDGASLIGVEDAAGNMAATDVEAALAEIYVDYVAADDVDKAALAAVTNGNGAALVGVEDAAGYYTGTTVETVLAEIIPAQIKVKTADQSVTTSVTPVDDTHLTGFVVEPNSRYAITGFLDYDQSVGNLRIAFTYDVSPAKRHYQITGVAEDLSTDADTDNAGNELVLDGLGDGSNSSAVITGMVTFGAVSSGLGKLQWAQGTSDVTATTLKEGSWIKFERII